MLAPLYHVLPLATIERERTLPVAGEVLTKLNQKVSPSEVIAEATWAREHLLIDVARELDISPNVADRLMRVKAGEKVSANAEIAISKGIFPRTIRAPHAGRVVVAGGGQVLIGNWRDISGTKSRLARNYRADYSISRRSHSHRWRADPGNLG